MSRAIWIGGPNHGKVVGLPEGVLAYAYPERTDVRHVSFAAYTNYSGMDFKTLTCPIIDMRLAPGKTIRAINHPEITEDTARRYLADLVIGAWEKKLTDTR